MKSVSPVGFSAPSPGSSQRLKISRNNALTTGLDSLYKAGYASAGQSRQACSLYESAFSNSPVSSAGCALLPVTLLVSPGTGSPKWESQFIARRNHDTSAFAQSLGF